MLSRISWRIFDKVRTHTSCPRQKGFVSDPGYYNIQILCDALYVAKAGSGLMLIQIHVSKVFVTVPHEVIHRALGVKGFPEVGVRLVEKSYTGVTTNIAHCGENMRVELMRGVKQGHPLSPWFFYASKSVIPTSATTSELAGSKGKFFVFYEIIVRPGIIFWR